MRYQGGYGSRLHKLQPLSSNVFGVLVTDELDPMRYVLTAERNESVVTRFRITLQRTRRE